MVPGTASVSFGLIGWALVKIARLVVHFLFLGGVSTAFVPGTNFTVPRLQYPIAVVVAKPFLVIAAKHVIRIAMLSRFVSKF